MNTRSIVAALALAITGTAAFADGATYEYPQAIKVQKSRAEVKAELLQARADGYVQVSEAGYPQVQFVAQKSRADVHAETLAAVASGELRRLNQEPYGDDNRYVPLAVKSMPRVLAAAK